MLKKLTLLAMAIAAFSALVAPALASAADEWTKNGATLTTNDVVHFEGTAKFNSESLGSVHCTENATASVTLSAGTNEATVTQFTANNKATDCHVGGLIASLCGAHSLTNVELLKNANAEGTNTGIVHITEVELLNEFGECLTLVLTGGVTATFDSASAAHEATLSGELETGGFGPVIVSGVLGITAPQSGVYGIKAF